MSQGTGWVNEVLNKVIPGRTSSKRAHPRIERNIETRLNFVERGYSVEGVVKEVSRGGSRFRPGLSHILRRTGDEVSLELGEMQVRGEIMRTYGDGYGIKFRTLLTEEELAAVLAHGSVLR